MTSLYRQFALPLISIMMLLLSGVPAHADFMMEEESAAVEDPFEPFNRAIFEFNQTVDGVLIAPAARAYEFFIPNPVEQRISNALRNLQEPVNAMNALLQGDAHHTFSSIWRFILNSTFGVVGLFDFAHANAGLAYHPEDFGQTLGCYGVGGGPYLMLPLMGPSNLRDTAGFFIDNIYNPFNYSLDDETLAIRVALEIIDTRARLLPVTDDIEATSFDPYVSYRSYYNQRQSSRIENYNANEKQYDNFCING